MFLFYTIFSKHPHFRQIYKFAQNTIARFYTMISRCYLFCFLCNTFLNSIVHFHTIFFQSHSQ